MKTNTIIVVKEADCLSYLPQPLTSLPPYCAGCVYAQALISLLHTQIKTLYQNKNGNHKSNSLSHPPLITLWLQTSSTHLRDNVAFREVSTVRSYHLSPPHNLK